MATLKSINKYQIYLASHPQFNEWIANIILRQQDNTLIADVRFVADPDTWVSFGSVSPNGSATIYVGIERLPWFVDVLRNEKPLFVVLYDKTASNPARMLLQTGPGEPIGETEPFNL